MGGTYQVGDTLMVGLVRQTVEGYGQVVARTGLVRVVDVSRPENVAEVIATYAPVRDHQVVLPAERFVDPGNVRPVPISDGVQANLLAHRDRQPLTGPQDGVFLNRGRKDGVAIGDLFELRQRARSRVDMATSFLGADRIKHEINALDCQTCRPGPYQDPFYNTQGRK